jgi:hypothetical protein
MATVRVSLFVAVSLLTLGQMAALPDASLAASPTGPPGRAPGGAMDVLHQVMPGDGLRLIAGYYYGDTRQWERIWEVNRYRVRNPNQIEQGSFLRIPDARVPAEPYADFLSRARRPALPPVAVAPPPGGEGGAIPPEPGAGGAPSPPAPPGPPAAAVAPGPAAAPAKPGAPPAPSPPPAAPPPAKRP